MSLRRKIFYTATLATVALLLILPTTGWLARMQLLPFTHPNAVRAVESTVLGSKVSMERYETAAQAVIARSGGDFTLRYAHSLHGTNSHVLMRLELLNRSYPRNPKVIATILRYMTIEAVKLRRTEQDILAVPRSRESASTYETQSDPAEVAKFIDYARQGEAIEPNNAYFAVMMAVGHFVARRDEVAAAAWVRASEKPDWNEHMADELTARWKLQRAMNDGAEVGSLARINATLEIQFPHYPLIRAGARMATVSAVQAELSGDREGGLVLRRATREIGEKMTRQSKYAVPCLVGYAVVAIGSGRPGGAPAPSHKKETSGDERAHIRETEFIAYLRQNGHGAEAATFESVTKHGKSVKKLWFASQANTYSGGGEQMFRLLGAWCVNLLLTAGVAFSLVFAGIFKLVYKFSPRLQKGEPLQKSARWGVAAGFVLPLVAAGVALSAIGLPVSYEQTSWIVYSVAIALVVAPPLVSRFSWREMGHGLCVMFVTLASLAVLVGVGALCGLFARPVADMFGMCGMGNTDEDASRQAVREVIRPWEVGAVVLSVPLGLLALFGVFSNILKVPLAAGVTRGMRAMAVPLSCVLALIWAGTLLYTAKHEHAAIREMERIAAIGEIRHAWEISGKHTSE